MFDLERSIERWRQTLATTPGLTAEAIAELESHVREEFQRLRDSGLEPEPALALAVERLGAPAALAREFEKVAAEPMAPWWPMRVVVGAAALLLLLLVGWLTVRGLSGHLEALLVVHVSAITIGYSMSFVAGILALCYVVQNTVRDLRPEQRRGLTRGLYFLAWTAALLTGVGVVLGSIWAKDHLGRWWGWDAKETGGAIVLGWNVLMVLFLRRCAGREEDAILLGLVGSAFVCLAWFGAALYGTGRSYSEQGYILGMVILAHAAVYLVGQVQVRRLWSRRA
jgi:hypothetical protein